MIDFNFIAQLEGGMKTRGYVPDAGNSKSGVTVGIGIDLGQMNVIGLRTLSISNELKDKLEEYVGRKGMEALMYLQQRPLEITYAEAQQLTQAVKSSFLEQLKRVYDAAPAKSDFINMPQYVRTVIASVAFQYGVGLASRCPKFWKTCLEQNVQEMIKELRNFGDRYPTRRNAEANYLQRGLSNGNWH